MTTATLDKPETSIPLHPAEDTARLQRELMARGVKYCIGAYVDIHGVPKAKVVPIAHLDRKSVV
jgi:glutamine synthetase